MVKANIGPESREIAPGMVVFNATTLGKSTITSWENGPQKQPGTAKRGRPRKEHNHLRIAERPKNPRFDFVNYTEAPTRHGAQLQRVVKSRAMLDYRQREREKKRENQGNLLSIVNNMSNLTLLPEVMIGDSSGTPIKMEQYMIDCLTSYTNSIYELTYSIEKYADYNPVVETWLPMAFRDSALLHCLIFCADECRKTSHDRRERPEAVLHLKRAIELVNARLAAPEPDITDGTIVVVCTLANTEKLKGNVENWKIHINGLKQIVELRGGIETFSSKRLLRNKIHRADLCGSIDLVQKPVFEFYRESPTIAGCRAGEFVGIKSGFNLDQRLEKITRQVHEITLNMNLIHLKTADIHPLSLREDITSLQYALLSLDFQSDDGPHQLINRTVQLAYLIYLVTILDEALPGGSICDGLGRRLASCLEKLPPRDLFTDEFLLWVAFCAASIVINVPSRTIFQELAIRCREGLRLISWDDAEATFRSFFWIEKIHGKSFRRVWKALEQLES